MGGRLLAVCTTLCVYFARADHAGVDDTVDVMPFGLEEMEVEAVMSGHNAKPTPGADALLSAYKETHRAIMADPTRRHSEVVVFEAHYNGFGDRFISAVSTFALAVLSNRAFQMTFTNKKGLDHTSILDVITPNGIDWAWYGAHKEAIPKSTFVEHHFGSAFGSEVDQNANRFFAESNFEALSPGKNLFFTMNAGRLHLILKNPHYQAKLQALGINIDNFFRILWRFLAKPSGATKELVDKHFTPVLVGAEVLKIGIHIRFGDGPQDGRLGGDWRDPAKAHALVTQHWDAMFKPFFDAAATITDVNVKTRTFKKVVWVVASDLEAVKAIAADRFPDKVATRQGFVDHTSTPKHGTKGIVAAYGEIEALSRCDHFVVTSSSAFAKMAIFLSNAVNPMIVCPYAEMQGKAYEGPSLTSLDGVYQKMFSRETLAGVFFPLF